MIKKYFFSPTVLYSYTINDEWWIENGGTYNSRNIFDYDGFDEYGFDSFGRDRAWKSESDYHQDKILYEEIKKDFGFYLKRVERIT